MEKQNSCKFFDTAQTLAQKRSVWHSKPLHMKFNSYSFREVTYQCELSYRLSILREKNTHTYINCIFFVKKIRWSSIKTKYPSW